MTGCAGFVGSHLTEQLLRLGIAVIGVDNLLTGRWANIGPLMEQSHFTFINTDVAAQPNLDAIVAEHCDRADTVFHFASPASPLDYARWPLQTLLANSRGTEHALSVAQHFGARFVLASTSEVYGDPLQHPQREDYWGNVNPVGPRSCYDESKRYAEALVVAAQRAGFVDAVILRIFNTYGPRMRHDDGRVVPAFITQALRGEPLTVFGNGEQTRSFMYIDDLVEAILRSSAVPLNGEALVVNVGNPDEISVRTLATLIASLVGVQVRLQLEKLPVDDPARRKPDIARAREALDWQPHTDLVEGLRATIDYLRGELKAA